LFDLTWLTSGWYQCLRTVLGNVYGSEQCFITVLENVSYAAYWQRVSKNMKYFRTTLETILRNDKNLKQQLLSHLKLPSWLTRVTGLVFAYFSRFLLICQLEALDLTLALNDFWSLWKHCLGTVLRNRFAVFWGQNWKMNFKVFEVI